MYRLLFRHRILMVLWIVGLLASTIAFIPAEGEKTELEKAALQLLEERERQAPPSSSSESVITINKHGQIVEDPEAEAMLTPEVDLIDNAEPPEWSMEEDEYIVLPADEVDL